MTTPAPPPRKKKQSSDNNINSSAEKGYISGMGISNRRLIEADSTESLLNEVPDSTVGVDVSIAGDLEFDRLLRIEGKFEGKLITKNGNIIIGSKGTLIGDVNSVNLMIVFGKVVGNILVERLILRETAQIFGDISCKSLIVEDKVIMLGNVNIHPQAPKYIDSDGKIITRPKRALTQKQLDTPASPRKEIQLKEAEWGSTKTDSKLESKSNHILPKVNIASNHASAEKLRTASPDNTLPIIETSTTRKNSKTPNNEVKPAVVEKEKEKLMEDLSSFQIESKVISEPPASVPAVNNDPVVAKETIQSSPPLKPTPFDQVYSDHKESIETVGTNENYGEEDYAAE